MNGEKSGKIALLREKPDGKIYIYLDSESTCRRFLRDAENEGFTFGDLKPTSSGICDIVALEHGRKLAHAGFAGHMAFHNPSGVKGGLYRVDYAKFADGMGEFLI